MMLMITMVMMTLMTKAMLMMSMMHDAETTYIYYAHADDHVGDDDLDDKSNNAIDVEVAVRQHIFC